MNWLKPFAAREFTFPVSTTHRIRAALVSTLLIGCIALGAGPWQPLQEDGVHDATNVAVGLLQQPEEALSLLPTDTAGNKVNWVTAIRSGAIKPRSGVLSDDPPEVLDLDILMANTSGTPYVVFPHMAHTEWMACEVCHEELFKSEIGANDIGMGHILDGEHCGRCHGAVAFPLTECNRCHSVNSNDVPERLREQLDAATAK